VRIGGAWVGLGVGDTSEEIRKIKAHMRRKFSYAKTLSDTTLFDAAMFDTVVEMQRRYNTVGQLGTGTYTPGIINPETKYVMGYLPRPPKPDARPVLFTVCGTGVPWWVGPDADTARAVESKYHWQPIGYPAQPVPMGPSIKAGRAELVNQITLWRKQIEANSMALAGYSQGAIVIAEVWERDIKPANGTLAWAKPFLRKAVAWGNPSREKGKVWPDAGAKTSGADRQGVTGTLMVDTPDWWRNYAHVGDLYSDCPDDESGENRTAIWQIIRDGSMVKGPDSLLSQLLELSGTKKDASQIAEVTGMFKAMIDAIVFFGKQTQPHTNYSTAEAVAYLLTTA
jgi:hypothetical protein